MLFDVFNGDADGLCALHQLRLAEPATAELVTGVKRDIALLQRVPATPGTRVTALDIAVEKNLEALETLLRAGAEVRWFDHHRPGPLPSHPAFHAYIDTDAAVCTSLIVDRHLGGRYRTWAVAAAFGDNLHVAARVAAAPLHLGEVDLGRLADLGTFLNYNAYGDTPADLHFHPGDLYQRLHAYPDPFAFVAESPEFAVLKAGYVDDMRLAEALAPAAEVAGGAVYVLPDAAWARRVSGVHANALARRSPGRAHALLTPTAAGPYVVSVRAPLARPEGADLLCARFATGGGRKAAAGINALPAGEVDAFVAAFAETYGAPA